MRNALDIVWSPARNWFDPRGFEALMSDLLDTKSNVAPTWAPALDVQETETHYLVSVDLPGVKTEDIKVEVEKGNLILQAERNFEKAHDERGVHLTERRYGSFRRSITLPEDANANSIEAAYEHGVLNVAVAKSEKTKPRLIEVKGDSKDKGFFSRFVKTEEKAAKKVD